MFVVIYLSLVTCLVSQTGDGCVGECRVEEHRLGCRQLSFFQVVSICVC